MLIFANSAINIRLRGFSLIELMVAIAVLAIIVSLAVPGFEAMIKNSQIRNAAESVSNGISKARAEAVSRNTRVDFILGSGTSWQVKQFSPAVVIESRQSNEGSNPVTLTALDAADVAATSITFDALGRIPPTTVPIAKIDFAADGGDKPLRVLVGLGGVKLCDPNLIANSSPLACPP